MNQRVSMPSGSTPRLALTVFGGFNPGIKVSGFGSGLGLSNMVTFSPTTAR